MGSQIDLQGGEDVGRGETDFLGLLAIDIRVDRRRARSEQREDACEIRILVGRGDKLLRRLRQRIGAEASAILNHHLEAAGVADALHRRRRDGQHMSFLNHRQAFAQVRENGCGRQAFDLVIVQRRQPGKDRSCVRRNRKGGRVQPCERRDVLDPRRRQDDFDRLLDHRFRPIKRCARW